MIIHLHTYVLFKVAYVLTTESVWHTKYIHTFTICPLQKNVQLSDPVNEVI